MKSDAAISSSEAAAMPAALARATVSALRPSSEVSTLSPLSVSLRPTAAPMAPGAITATTEVMTSSNGGRRPSYTVSEAFAASVACKR